MLKSRLIKGDTLPNSFTELTENETYVEVSKELLFDNVSTGYKKVHISLPEDKSVVLEFDTKASVKRFKDILDTLGGIS